MTKIPICQVCKTEEALYAWQPFGPQHDANCFTFLGNHYRGFMLIKICQDCKTLAQEGKPVEFTSSKTKFIGTSRKVYKVPSFSEPILYWKFMEENQGVK